MAKAKTRTPKTAEQLERFREMAREVGADESPGALERAFGKLDPKKAAAKPKRP